jgi:hypothetical protein
VVGEVVGAFDAATDGLVVPVTRSVLVPGLPSGERGTVPPDPPRLLPDPGPEVDPTAGVVPCPTAEVPCPTAEVLVAFGVLTSPVAQAAVARKALTAAAVRTVRPFTVLPGGHVTDDHRDDAPGPRSVAPYLTIYPRMIPFGVIPPCPPSGGNNCSAVRMIECALVHSGESFRCMVWV